MSGFVPNNNKIVNINSVNKNNNTIVKAENGFFTIKYYKDKTDFYDPKIYINYIKNIEKEIRTSEEYKTYIGYLKNEIGLDYCSVFGNVTDEKANIEMHHGPIFTLFDIVAIVIEHYIVNNLPISTFEIAKIVMQEHYENHIQIVMLSKTAHEAVHAGKIFISPAQAFGDINPFIEKYGDGMTQEQIDTYNKYLEIAKVNRTTDNGIFRTDLTDWNIEKASKLTEEDIDGIDD